MKHILCYGDSNTYGAIPKAKGDPSPAYRYAHDVRWTGVLARLLGSGYRIIEEGFNGRTTCFTDPTFEGRNGAALFAPILLTHLPLDLIVIMLGTNDTKAMLGASAADIARGMERLVKTALNPYLYPDKQIPKLLVVSPVKIDPNIKSSPFAGTFDEGSIARADALAGCYRELADTYGLSFLDAAAHADPSPLDCIHLDAEGHGKLAAALAERIRGILSVG